MLRLRRSPNTAAWLIGHLGPVGIHRRLWTDKRLRVPLMDTQAVSGPPLAAFRVATGPNRSCEGSSRARYACGYGRMRTAAKTWVFAPSGRGRICCTA